MEDFNIDILINKENLLLHDYVPHDLVVLDKNKGNFRKYMDSNLKPMVRREMIKDLSQMLSDAKKEGFSLIVDSAYRSYDYQYVIFNDNVKKLGYEEAKKVVALPGASEHQTGLCIDIAYYYGGKFNDNVTDEDKEVKWLKKNCHKYGFILRYPKGKENITGYNYEPWHYRYVGKRLAGILHDNDETLEEYYERKSLM